ncbi:hypothetical protein GCM10010910_03710 [Microbacterium nanhaiense]|uniref:N-acetyltransferase domain-containing protein n=1 Tax=Microbacterium nanhaiense TaxID=1301026 RepID=A0ABQ2MXU6_9MICO|nr:GNAT family N-acetyltransferase [Microbacterium nanhaiense]GGO59820.1 hypothetical protein GCM10010910_03710 [Microbacterium nanhaiense]
MSLSSASLNIFSCQASDPLLDTHVAAVIALASAHKKTLGFLTDAVFKKAADAGHLTLAYSSDVLVGYALYRITRATIKLTQVCVASESRGKNLGAHLIEHVINQHPDAVAITASCRRDYNLDSFWRGAGLSPSSEKAGRNAQGLPLTLWFRKLGTPDLFTTNLLFSDRPIAVLDSNIIIDLHARDEVHRPNREASRALVADWLAEEIEFAVSVQVDHELNKLGDDSERKIQTTFAQEWTRLPTERPFNTDIENELKAIFGQPALRKDVSLESDICHIADAVRASAKYFVTNDEGVLAMRNPIREKFGLLIARPHEVVTDIAENPGILNSYSPGVFENLSLSWHSTADFDEQSLEKQFMNYAAHEKAKSFRPRLRSGIASMSSQVLTDDESPTALLAANVSEDALEVSLLRVAAGQHQSSIALQLARQLRMRAVGHEKSLVRISDPALPRVVQTALHEDGYQRDSEGSFIARPINYRGALTDFEAYFLDASTTLIQTSNSHDLERQHWPLRIWDDRPCYVVSIKPTAAMDLFAYPPNLLQQRRALGLSRRHIYYRSGRSNPFKHLPARVLWYASQEKGNQVQQFFAVSNAVASHTLPAGDAHEKFNRFGVYKKRQVEATADPTGNVTVLEVEDTEVLTNPIHLKTFRKHATPHGVTGEFFSPRSIPAQLFQELMSEYNQPNSLA